MRLKDRVAIVTGGSSGIGRGIAIELARNGADVAIADLQEPSKIGKYHEQDVKTTTCEEIAKLGREGLFVQTDMTDDDHVANLIDRTIQWRGKLDILVNNAGMSIVGDSQTQTIQEWDKVVALDLRAVFVCTKLAVPHLIRSKRGRVIQIASVHAFYGGGGPSYAPAKAGVVNIARDSAVELGKHGITVNAICPGYIETAIQDYLTPEVIEQCRKRTVIPRLGKPADVGNLAAFLASDDAEWLTGAAIVLDGGLTAHMSV